MEVAIGPASAQGLVISRPKAITWKSRSVEHPLVGTLTGRGTRKEMSLLRLSAPPCFSAPHDK